MAYAIVQNGRIVSWSEATPIPGGVEVPDNTDAGWELVEGQWVDPKASQKSQLAAFQSALNEGFTDPVLNIKLKTTDRAQEMFTKFITMIQEGLSLGLITNDTLQVVWDYNDQPRQLSVLQIRQMLFRYGIHCKTFFDDLAP